MAEMQGRYGGDIGPPPSPPYLALHLGDISPAYTSPVPPLHLRRISAASPLHLPDISPHLLLRLALYMGRDGREVVTPILLAPWIGLGLGLEVGVGQGWD